MIRYLQGRDWPGNVRELENFLERALLLSPGPELQLGEASSPVTTAQEGSPADAAPRRATFDGAVRDLLVSTLEATGGRIYGNGGAADLLGLKPTTLQGKLKKYGIDASYVRATHVFSGRAARAVTG